MIEYNFSIVSFFDVLGFKKIIEEKKNPQDIKNILDVLRRFSEPDTDLSNMYEIKFTNFSDSIVRSINIFSDTNIKTRIGILFWEILNLLHIQIELINKGIIIRGGLTIDNIYHKNPYVFGPALNRSYELENKIAKYPIILIDEDIIDLVSEPILRYEIHDYNTEKGYIESLLRKYDEKYYFIDYLRVAFNELDDIELYPQYLLKHKNIIINNYNKYLNCSNIADKYLWMTEYHNDVIDHMKDKILTIFNDIELLKIDLKQIQTKNLFFVGDETWRNDSKE